MKMRVLLPAMAWLLLAAIAQGQTAGQAAGPVAVRILSPEPGQPVFGSTDVRVGVQAAVPIDRVEVFVNGKLAGTCKKPPYHVQVDVGEDNVKREFKAVAYTPTGTTGADSVLTQPVTINDQMDLKLRALFVSVVRDGARA
ncbi:MAG TPA: Ig-like domain-containing protein, partial [Thermoanaerobaculia bacterium]|nr:Ig-like domain-containing protein [Thermoanaerobaculia bacterium]